MMICKADFDELFPHLIAPNAQPDCTPAPMANPIDLAGILAAMPAAAFYLPMWARLAGYGPAGGVADARGK